MVTTYERPQIDDEFAALIPPQDPSELKRLEENLIRDGCLDPLRVWAPRNILLDGHTRLRICTKRAIPFDTVEIECESRDEAKEWIIRNQLGRRNLDTYTRVTLGKALEDSLAAQAAANLSAGGGDKKSEAARKGRGSGSPKSEKAIEPLDRNKEAAKAAGVSLDTYAKGKAIKTAVDAGVLDRSIEDDLRAKKTTINAEYKKLVAEHPEVVKRRARKAAPAALTTAQYEALIMKVDKAARAAFSRGNKVQRKSLAMHLRSLGQELGDEAEASNE